MCIRFILLLTITIIAVQGEISPSTIKSDAVHVAKAYRLYLKSFPGSLIEYLEEKRCPWMMHCCPNEFAHFFTLMRKPEDHLEKECLISTGDKIVGPGLGMTCKQKIEEAIHSEWPVHAHLERVINYQPHGFTAIRIWIQKTEEMCSVKELHAFYCESSHLEKLQSCMEKTLESIARDNGDTYYSSFVQKLQNEYTTFNGKYLEAVTPP